MFCHKCGKELVEGSQFCSSCGAAIETPSTAGVTEPGPVQFAQPRVAPVPVYTAEAPEKSMVPLIIGAVIGGVLLILLLLFLIAFPVYNSSRKNAQKRTCQANIRTIDGAISAYYADNEKNPDNIGALVEGQYLKTTPTCPSGPKPYTLETSTEGVLEAHCPNDPSHSL